MSQEPVPFFGVLSWRDAEGLRHPAPMGTLVYLDSLRGLIPGRIVGVRRDRGVLELQVEFDAGAKALHWSGLTENAWAGRTEWWSAREIVPRAAADLRRDRIKSHTWEFSPVPVETT